MQNKEFIVKIWNNIQIKLQKFIENDNFYENFILKTNLIKIENKIAILETPNDFSKNVIISEYLDKIEKFFLEYTNEIIKIKVVSKDSKQKEKKNEIDKNNYEDNLNYKLNFQNFIVGNFNKKVFKAAKQICSNKEIIYNPFLIYGDTGLGKTHLINSMGLEFKNKGLKVILLNSEDFIQKACKYLPDDSKGIENFKESFNDYDILIMDDIQFISNKNKINELFFTIFNRYIKKNKLIIMSSDRIPNELKIDNRMISRLNSGLSINISKPDINTIYEIIKYKIKENINNIKFTDNAIKFIANRFNSDIRSLEGVINKILFQISITESDNYIINQEKIKEILDSDIDNKLLNKGYYTLSPNILIENVSIMYGVSKDLVCSKSRKKEISFVRQICIYIMRERMDLSYAEIGNYFSNRNHSTILESYNKIKNKIKNDKDLEIFIENIIKNI